jgi:hypothetical protein
LKCTLSKKIINKNLRRFIVQFNKTLRLVGVFILLLVVVAVFTGCGGTPISDQVKIENVINDCFLAMSNQEWNKARSFSVYNSNFYNFVSDMESMVNNVNLEHEYTLEFSFSIVEIIIDGNYATVNGSISFIENLDGEVGETVGEEETLHLEKINNSWKLF